MMAVAPVSDYESDDLLCSHETSHVAEIDD
jgi:hypothetical protein